MVDSRALLMLVAGAVVGASGAAACEIEVIYTEIPGHPTSLVPGALDLAGLPLVTQFRALEDFTFRADGSQWILKGRTEAGSDLDTIMLLGSGVSGTALAQEGQPVAGGAPGELYDFFDPIAGFNSFGDYAFGARARNGDSTIKEKIIVFDGSFGIPITESVPCVGLVDVPGETTGDELFGNSLNSIHLLDDGRVGFVALTIQNVHSSRRPAIFYDDQAFAQSGVTPIGGSIWDSFDGNGFFTTPDGAHWLALGEDETGGFGSPVVLAYDGAVAIIEGQSLGGVTVADVFNVKLLDNGDWFARGDDPAENDWAAVNGTLVAKSGDPVTSGGLERWTDVFLAFTGNRVGDWVLAGSTDAADAAADQAIVLNGETVVCREGDPVDLDGNGRFDDDVFIGRGDSGMAAFNANDLFLTDDRELYVLAPLRNGAGQDLAMTGAGDAFLRITIMDDACPGDLDGCGTVDVQDLVIVLLNWGPCKKKACPGDTNGDNMVDVEDMVTVILGWGPCL